MSNQKKVFDTKSSGFALSILTLIFGLLTVLGIDLPDNPNALAGEIVNSVSTLGWVGLFGAVGSGVAGIVVQVYNRVRSNTLSLNSLFSSVNTWIYVATFLGSIAAIYGLNLPSESLTDLVLKLSNADYFGAFAAIAPLISTIIRFIRDQKKTVATA
jgi:short subunit fatty acids transporter